MLTPNINKYIVVDRSMATSRASSVIQNALQKIDLKQAKFSRDPPVGNSNSKSSLFMANEFRNRTLIDQLIESISQWANLAHFFFGPWYNPGNRWPWFLLNQSFCLLYIDWSMMIPCLSPHDYTQEINQWCVCFYDLHSKWDIQQK